MISVNAVRKIKKAAQGDRQNPVAFRVRLPWPNWRDDLSLPEQLKEDLGILEPKEPRRKKPKNSELMRYFLNRTAIIFNHPEKKEPTIYTEDDDGFIVIDEDATAEIKEKNIDTCDQIGKTISKIDKTIKYIQKTKHLLSGESDSQELYDMNRAIDALECLSDRLSRKKIAIKNQKDGNQRQTALICLKWIYETTTGAKAEAYWTRPSDGGKAPCGPYFEFAHTFFKFFDFEAGTGTDLAHAINNLNRSPRK